MERFVQRGWSSSPDRRESVVNKILKTFIPTSRWDGEQAVGVQLEEEEVERLMDVMHAFNLEEAQSVCVCCVSVAHMP